MSAERYLREAREALFRARTENAEDIAEELRMELDERLREYVLQGMNRQEAIEAALSEMPQADRLASLRYEERRFLPLQLPAAANAALLFLGLLLAYARYALALGPAEWLWQAMVAGKWFILFGYSSLWLLAGYCYGKRNGLRERRKTVIHTLLALAPNAVFMLTVILLLRSEWVRGWFGFVRESSGFLAACVFCTLSFYSFWRLGYRKGIWRGR